MDREAYALLIVPAVSALLSYGFTPISRWLSFRVGAVDQPDARKVHDRPMPRLGGIAVIAAVILALGLASLGGPAWSIPAALLPGLVIGLIPIVAVSLVDDIRPVPARIKFLCHIAGASAAVIAGISLPPQLHVLGYEFSVGIFAAPISVLWLAGVTSAFNIIDGLDGLAAGLAFISAVAVSAVLLTVGQLSAALVPLALAGALVGFLPFNLYPAKIFLGDTGATFIGFALAALALKGGSTMSAGFAAAMPLLILGLPIADTVVAILRRLVRMTEQHAGGVFEPDKDHVHHRLVALGLHHRQAVRLLHGLGVVMAVVAYLSLFVSYRDSALLLLGLLIAGAVGLQRLGYDEFALLRRGTILRVYETPVLKRAMFVAFVDVAFVCVSVYIAIGLKTDDWGLFTHSRLAFQATALLVPLSVAIFWKTRLYEGSWRLATINDYVRATLSCGMVVAVAIVLSLLQFQSIPGSLLIVYGLVSTFFVVGARTSYRVLVAAQRAATGPTSLPALIYGPGPTDFLQARDLIDRAASFGLKTVGFVMPTGAGRGQLLAGVRILGSIHELESIAGASKARIALLARRPNAFADRFAELCRDVGLQPYRLNTDLEVMGNIDPASQLLVLPGVNEEQEISHSSEWHAHAGWPRYRVSPGSDPAAHTGSMP